MKKSFILCIVPSPDPSWSIYAIPVFVGMHKCFEGVFQKLDNRVHRLIYGEHCSDTVQKRKCNCPKPNNLLLRRQEQRLKLFTTILESPSHLLHSRLPRKSRPTRTRTSRLILPYSRTALRRASFVPYCAQLWNSLPRHFFNLDSSYSRKFCYRMLYCFRRRVTKIVTAH